MSRLHTRIYLHSLLVLLVVAVVTTGIFAWGARRVFIREVAERTARHAASLAGEALGDGSALAHRVRQLHDDLGIDVTVRDLDGRVLAAAGPELPALGPEDAARVRAGDAVIVSRPVWFAAAAVRDPSMGAVMGTLAVAAPHRVGFWGFLRPAFAVLVVLVVVAVATRPLARRISRPIEGLTEAARRLGGGDLSSRVPVAQTGGRRWWRGRPHAAELQELTRAFNDMAERVERLVRDQQELLANVSHELRSPLARIRMALALLPRDGENEARLADIETDLAELDRLIEDVLTTTRLEATGLPPRLDAVEAQELLAQLAERSRHDPLLAGKEVRVAPGPRLPLTADAVLVKRALWNLVENAAKYGAPPITLSAWADVERVALGVADEGEGIPPEERERVFAPFYRIDRARTPGPPGAPRGVGLGLTLARRVAEVHGGTIAIEPLAAENGRERGCRVVLRLPRRI